MSDQHAEGSHGYWDWQVSTLMLAHDTVDPIGRDDLAAQQRRQAAVEREVREVAMSVIPPEYQIDEGRELTPEIVIRMTRATLKRAAEIVGLL